jgi:hypothetical protein
MNRHSVPNAILGLPGRPIDGGSNPRFYDFDDGATRLVKWHPSAHGAKACYNELVASRLGQLIGAPILRGGVVYVPKEIIPGDHLATGAKEGFHFGVYMMDGGNFVPTQHYAEIENTSQLPYTAVFLSWLAIGDQEGHNQYLQQLELGGVKTKRFKLVDMGFMFGSPDWTRTSIAKVHEQYKIPTHLAGKLTFEKLKPAIAELKAIDDEAIRLCFDDCPDEWGVSKEDKEAGATNACAARNNIEQIFRKGNPSIA